MGVKLRSGAKADVGPLTKMEEWLKSNFEDFTTFMSTTAKGMTYLCTWRASKLPIQDIHMNYLPIFYIVVEVGADSLLSMKVLTFHGRVVAEFNDKASKKCLDSRLQFINEFLDLRLCQGIREPEVELMFNSETFSRIYLLDDLQWKRPILRSRACLFGVSANKGEQVCENCSAFNTSMLLEDAAAAEKHIATVDTNDCQKEEEEDVKPDLLDLPLDLMELPLEEDGSVKLSQTNGEVFSNTRKRKRTESLETASEASGHLLMNEEPELGNDEDVVSSHGDGDAGDDPKCKRGSGRKCPICKKGGFKSMSRLRRHCWYSHFKVTPYKCNHCSYKAVEAFTIHEHCKEVHDKKGRSVVLKEEMKRLKSMEVDVGIRKEAVSKASKIKRTRKPRKKIEKPNKTAKRRSKEGDQMPDEASEAERKELPARPFCEVCCVDYDEEAFKLDQEKHEASREANETVRCPTCFITVMKVQLNEHFGVDHHELRAAVCLECMKVFSPKEKMPVHFDRCHRELALNLCPVCGISTKCLKHHMKSCARDKRSKLMCSICGGEFVSKVILNRHIQFVHTSEKNSKCKFCGVGLKTDYQLRMHYWAMHLNVKPFKCKHCSYAGKVKNRIYAHCREVHKLKGDRSDVVELEDEFEKIREFEVQHGISRKKVNVAEKGFRKICWLCGKHIQQHEKLVVHELNHLELKPYRCCSVGGCGSAFASAKFLKEHLEIVHGEEEDELDEQCRQQDQLDIYEKVRSLPAEVLKTYDKFKKDQCKDSIVSIQCSKCEGKGPDNCFASLGHFYSHMHDVHISELKMDEKTIQLLSGEKMVCKVCELETMSSKLLERHVDEVHKMDTAAYESYVPPPVVEVQPKAFRPRQYRCKHCFDYTAVKKFTVHRHIKKVHKIMDSTDDDLLLISDK